MHFDQNTSQTPHVYSEIIGHSQKYFRRTVKPTLDVLVNLCAKKGLLAQNRDMPFVVVGKIMVRTRPRVMKSSNRSHALPVTLVRSRGLSCPLCDSRAISATPVRSRRLSCASGDSRGLPATLVHSRRV